MRLGSVLTTDDLPLAELCALRLDGELFAIDEFFTPIDQPDDPAQRARSLAIHCQDRLIAEQRSAAWIWGASDLPPSKHTLCASIGARARPPHVQRALAREVVIDDDEWIQLGGVRVTLPLRTIIDLARFDWDAVLVGELMHLYGITLDDCRAELDRRHNLPNKVRAWKRLSAGSAKPPADPPWAASSL